MSVEPCTLRSGDLNKLHELQLLDAYLNCMALDIPMLNAAKSEREWDWFFHKLEEGFLVAEVDSSILKMKLAKRFMRGRQLYAWCDLMNEVLAAGGRTADEPAADDTRESDLYESIRDKMYLSFFPHSDYFNSLMELFGGYRENRNESPRRRMSLVGVKLVIGTAKETMMRVAKRYGRDMPPESFWYQFALRLMTPTVKELFDAKIAELTGSTTQATAAATTAAAESQEAAVAAAAAAGPEEDNQQQQPSSTEEGKKPADDQTTVGVGDEKSTATTSKAEQVFPDMPIEQMLNSIKDPNARSMRAPHKFRRTIRKNRSHGASGSATVSGKKDAVSANSPSARTNVTTSTAMGGSAEGMPSSPSAAAVMGSE